ncbi:HD-GYP domain-containing protein [Salinarimonas ramus]|uniref:Metal-dependent phosphohydrolase n=1 Tax=Salinarimonas ramus TaxID=690164 RepID=A0A917QAC2_9HYPH|nr:HD domain-containing protein [Salinarimonas ramus]GGK38809.1 metal-dependent phosphohydrolase [Salinarimonas ramus]
MSASLAPADEPLAPSVASEPLALPALPEAEAGELALADVLGALSHALDITEGQPPGHALRCAYIAHEIGCRLGLHAATASDLFYAVLLKDLGCSSNAARICALYLTDDRTFKHDFKLVGDSLPQALRFVLDHTGLGHGLAARFSAVIEIVRNGGEIARELIETRCERGAGIARAMGFSETVARGIRDLDEHWDGGGRPRGISGEAIALPARVALLAQVADVFRSARGGAAALKEVRERAGTWFDPRIVEAFADAAAAPGFWEALAATDLEATVLALPPARDVRRLDGDGLDRVANAFAQVIDAKSPYTAGHSERVAFFAGLVAEEIGFPPIRRAWLGRAALLHDIGKLGVSNAILDKPGKLDDVEWVAMRNHARDSELILARIGAFGDLARIAGAHHERLDGRGYPYGLRDPQIGLDTRILSVADVFDALTADRPYRAGMPVEKALSILHADSGSALDGDCVAALERALARL